VPEAGVPWRLAMNAWLSAHYGVITTARLLGMGCPDSSLAGLIKRGDLITIARGVHRSAHVAPHEDQLLVAACALSPHAVVGFTSAAKHWNFRRIPRRGPHILLAHERALNIPGLIVHRCRRIDPIDVVDCGDLRVTSPPRTIFDCADMIGADATESVIEQLLDQQTCSMWMLTETLRRLGHHRRPGTRTFRAVLGRRPAWRRAVQTDLEKRVRDGFGEAGLPEPEAQYWIETPAGNRYRFDFAWPSAMVALEVDDSWWHAGAAASHMDKSRDLEVATIGWLTLRITEVDVDTGLPAALAKVAAVVASRMAVPQSAVAPAGVGDAA